MANFETSPLLELPSNIFVELKKIHNLDKPGRLDEAINILEQWLKKQKHMLKTDYSRHYLEETLIQCKGSVEKAKKQIDSLATMKTLLPKFFTLNHVSDVKNYKDLLQSALMVPLPKLTEDFYRVLIIKMRTNQFDADMLMMFYRFTILIAEYLKKHDYMNGLIIVIDFQETSLINFVKNLNYTDLQQFMTILIKGYGARIRNIYDITDSKAIDILLNTLKSFLSEKIRDRIQVLPRGDELQKLLPKEILPVEYGGDEKSIYTLWDEWVQEVSKPEYHEYMKIMNKAGTDESLRTSYKFNEEILGMPGSFRKMNVD